MFSPIVLYFAFATVCTIISGLYLPRLTINKRGLNFGIGLFFMGLGFAAWTMAMAVPTVEALNNWVSIGLAFILVAMLFFLRSGTQHVSKTSRRFVIILAGLYIITLWLVKIKYPVNPDFESSGVFLLNQHPVVKFMEIVLFTAVLTPASLSMFHDLRAKDRLSANTFFAALLTIRVGAILLLGVFEDIFIMLDGLAMGIAFLLLLLTSLGFFRVKKVRHVTDTFLVMTKNVVGPLVNNLKYRARQVSR